MGTQSPRPGGGGPSGTELPETVASELRSDERCRAILAALADAGEPVPLIDLTRDVILRERDADAIDADAVREVRADIHARDLPKLTAAGLVSFDSLVSTASITDKGRRLLDGDL